MSVAVIQPSAFQDEPLVVDPEIRKYGGSVDWGTATPVNHYTEIPIGSDIEFGHDNLKRGIKRKSNNGTELPQNQKALVLKELRQPFELEEGHTIPQTSASDELLVRIKAIGLNPIDWKSADYGFGIPVLPYVSGRDFAGIVVKAPASDTSLLSVGDVILCPSTDYRDLRKAAYQEYAVATESTVCRLPGHISSSQGAALGVAYVAATLALGVCLGVRMPGIASHEGPDLLNIVRSTPLGALPQDVIPECLATKECDRPKRQEWLVIWGGSSTSALFVSQIARQAGLRVVLVVDVAKHGFRMLDSSGCVCVDSHDPQRAIEVIRGLTEGRVRLGIDTVGKSTAEHLARCLRNEKPEEEREAHLVGLAALPKERLPGVVYHSVPVKLFHEVPAVGNSLMRWLEAALQSRSLQLPQVDEVPGGLGGINDALDLMRQGHVSGRRLVVPL